MTLVNSYATLQNFLDYKSTTSTDAVDDGMIELLLSGTSRYIDAYTSRTFYPRIEAHLFDVPDENMIYLDDDLCRAIALLNGDGTTISSSDYTLVSANLYPKWGIKLKDSSGLTWFYDSAASAEQVISLTGEWAYHNDYARQAWSLAGNLAAAITDTTSLTFTMANGHTVKTGRIYKIDSEVFNVTNVSSSDTVTVYQRGDNGSTAATHLTNTAVYVWNPQADIVQACLEIAVAAYQRRKGQYMSGTAQVTGAGVVITPQDVPGMAREILNKYVRIR